MTIGLNVSYSRVNSVGVSAGSLTGSPLGDAVFMDPTIPVLQKVLMTCRRLGITRNTVNQCMIS